MIITFRIPGPPRGKERPRVVRDALGRVHTYTPDKTADYEGLVRERYRQAEGVRFPDEAAIRLRITAGFPAPKSASRKNRARMLAGEQRPAQRPDWDNIGKIIADALNGTAYRDDAQVVEAWVEKVYVDGPGETAVTVEEV